MDTFHAVGRTKKFNMLLYEGLVLTSNRMLYYAIKEKLKP